MHAVPRTEAELQRTTLPESAREDVVRIFGEHYRLKSVRDRNGGAFIEIQNNKTPAILLQIGWGKLLSEYYRQISHVTVAPPGIPPEMPTAPPAKLEPPEVRTIREVLLTKEETREERLTRLLPRLPPLSPEIRARIDTMTDTRTGGFVPGPVRNVFREMFHVGAENVDNVNRLTSEMWKVLSVDFEAEEKDMQELSKVIRFMTDAANQVRLIKDLYGPKLLTVTDYLMRSARQVNAITHRIVMKRAKVTGHEERLRGPVLSDADLVARALFEATEAKGNKLREEVRESLESALRAGDLAPEALERPGNLFEPLEQRLRVIVDYMTGRLMRAKRMSPDQRRWFRNVFSQYVTFIQESEEYKRALAPTNGSERVGQQMRGGVGIGSIISLVVRLLFGALMIMAVLMRLEMNPVHVGKSTGRFKWEVNTAADIGNFIQLKEKSWPTIRDNRTGAVDWDMLHLAIEQDLRQYDQKMDQLGEKTGFKKVKERLDKINLEQAETKIGKAERFLGLVTQGTEVAEAGAAILEAAPEDRVKGLEREGETIASQWMQLADFQRSLHTQFSTALTAQFVSEEALDDFQQNWQPYVLEQVMTERMADIGKDPATRPAHATLSIVKQAISSHTTIRWEDLSTDVEDSTTMIHFANEIAGRVDRFFAQASNWQRERSLVKDLVVIYQTFNDMREEGFNGWVDTPSLAIDAAQTLLDSSTADISEAEETARRKRTTRFLDDLIFKRILDPADLDDASSSWIEAAIGRQISEEPECADLIADNVSRDWVATAFHNLRGQLNWVLDFTGSSNQDIDQGPSADETASWLIAEAGRMPGDMLFSAMGLSSLQQVYAMTSAPVQTFEEFWNNEQILPFAAGVDLLGSILLSYVSYTILGANRFLGNTAIALTRSASVRVRSMLGTTDDVVRRSEQPGHAWDTEMFETEEQFRDAPSSAGHITGGLRALSWTFDKFASFFEATAGRINAMPLERVNIEGMNLPSLGMMLPMAFVTLKMLRLGQAVTGSYGLTAGVALVVGELGLASATMTTSLSMLYTAGPIIIDRLFRSRDVRHAPQLTTEIGLREEERAILSLTVRSVAANVSILPYLAVHYAFSRETLEDIRLRRDRGDYTLGFYFRDVVASGANALWLLFLTRVLLPRVVGVAFQRFSDALRLAPRKNNLPDFHAVSSVARNSAFSQMTTQVATQTQQKCERLVQEMSAQPELVIDAAIYQRQATVSQTILDLSQRLDVIRQQIASIPEGDRLRQVNELVESLPRTLSDFAPVDMRRLFPQLPR